jgi:TatD DNase family protein
MGDERTAASHGGSSASPTRLHEMVDSHCHLDALDFVNDMRDVIQRGRDAGVGWFVTIGSGRGTESAADAVAIARTNRDVVACVGIHPLDASCATEPVLATLTELAEDWHVVAVGETGLDYRLAYAQKDAQKAAFRRQIQIARAAKKPLVIHSRSATSDTLAILREENARDVGGVIHSFADDEAFASAALDLGFDISLSALLLLHDLPSVRAAVRLVPPDRLLIESNAPVLAPPPDSGRRCEPADLATIAAGLAPILGAAPDVLRRQTAENAVRRFGLGEAKT